MKSWQEWLLFSSVMILVFMLGIGISSLLESRKEIATITYTQKVKITGVEARSPLFSKSYPREYQTWADTVTTHSLSDFRRDFSVDILAQRPEMVVLWAGYTFSKPGKPHKHWVSVDKLHRYTSYTQKLTIYIQKYKNIKFIKKNIFPYRKL